MIDFELLKACAYSSLIGSSIYVIGYFIYKLIKFLNND